MKNETIQVDGKFYNKSKVVMLPTEKASNNIVKDKNGNLYTNIVNIDLGQGHQHLYFLSEEEIKEGDWQYDSYYKRIEQYFHGKATGMSIYKIIATTDESLKMNPESYAGQGIPSLAYDNHTIKFPRPSNEFLQAYCKANGKIDEVLVEVEQVDIDLDTDFETEVNVSVKYKLKTAPDNTVTIKKLYGKLKLTQEEIDKRINMHDELISHLKFAIENTRLSSSYEDAVFRSKCKQLIKQAEAK